jgi:hypothetical protein
MAPTHHREFIDWKPEDLLASDSVALPNDNSYGFVVIVMNTSAFSRWPPTRAWKNGSI